MARELTNNPALDAIYNQLSQQRNLYAANLENIMDHETQIHDLKMINVDLEETIRLLEEAALILKKEMMNVKPSPLQE